MPKGVGSSVGDRDWEGECGGVKMETSVLEQQLKKKEKKKQNKIVKNKIKSCLPS